MRQLKFRAWYDDFKIMVEFGIGEDYFRETSPVDCEQYKLELCDSDSIMQFTGLLDSKGVEIYEGDVVDGFDGEFKAQVKWGNEDGAWVIDDLAKNAGAMLGEQYAENFEVIGNIHSNPDLL